MMRNKLHNNVSLAYIYTKEVIEDTNKSLDALNTKLTAVLAFSGLLLRFSGDLPETNDFFVAARLVVCSFFGLAVVFCCLGLQPKVGGAVVVPDDLIYGRVERSNGDGEKEYGALCYHESDERVRLFIIKTWLSRLPELDRRVESSFDALKKATWCIAAGSILLAICLATAPFFQSTQQSEIWEYVKVLEL